MTDELDLLGITEVAELIGLHRVTVSKMRREGKLPPTDFELPKRPLWRRETIEAWAAETGRAVKTSI